MRSREQEKPRVQLNRRAASPSWQSGRRGDAQGSEAGESADGSREAGRSSGDGGTEGGPWHVSRPGPSAEEPGSSGGHVVNGESAIDTDGNEEEIEKPASAAPRCDGADADVGTDSVPLGRSLSGHVGVNTADRDAEGGTGGSEDGAAEARGAAARSGGSDGAARESGCSSADGVVPRKNKGGDEAAEEVGPDGWTVVGSPRSKAGAASGVHTA